MNQRYETGLKHLKEIDQEAGEKVLDSLQEVSPDLANYIIEYAFGDVYNRSELALKSKELVVVAALTALGNAEPQLKVHIHGALNVGCNWIEIQEVILQMSAYSGFPSAINAMLALKEVLADRRLEGKNVEGRNAEGKENEASWAQSSSVPQGLTRYEWGAKHLTRLNPNQVNTLEETFQNISPDLARLVIEYGFADVFSRPALDAKHREMATIAALTALGTASSQLIFHIKAGLNIGLSQAEIREIMILMSVYSGFPSAINGTLALKEVLNDQSTD